MENSQKNSNPQTWQRHNSRAVGLFSWGGAWSGDEEGGAVTVPLGVDNNNAEYILLSNNKRLKDAAGKRRKFTVNDPRIAIFPKRHL